MTTVINMRDKRFGDVYIGRAGKGNDGYFGNPFPMYNESERAGVVERYKAWFLKRVDDDPEFRRRVLELKGKRLVCFCAPKACHGDVIAQWLDNQ